MLGHTLQGVSELGGVEGVLGLLLLESLTKKLKKIHIGSHLLVLGLGWV